MRIAGKRIVLRDQPRESDNQDHFRWRNLEEWDYYDEPWTPSREQISWEEWERRRRKREKTPHEPSEVDHCAGRKPHPMAAPPFWPNIPFGLSIPSDGF